MQKDLTEIKQFLDESYFKYNRPNFIENDPVCIPHRFSKKEDIEIAGFLAATIAWGNRKSIIKNADSLMTLMDNDPYAFTINHSKSELKTLQKFVHRTFNGHDTQFFIQSLKHIYKTHGGLEAVFKCNSTDISSSLKERIISFRNIFLETTHPPRSEKHISNPATKSSSKRLCMYLRWMVRNDKRGVDLGIWKSISPAELCLPLDVHTGNVSRTLGLLNRKQNDWQAVEEITNVLRTMDKTDPVKYDFALFGLGVEKVLS